jgi:ubiquinone/menaquinone biosynthesis C-methylase UbiE
MSDLYKKYFEVAHVYNPNREKIWRVIARYIQDRFIKRDARVLDLAAGYCSFINNIVAAERYALDRAAEPLTKATAGVKTMTGDCTNLSQFKDASLDVVFASNLLEHLTREDALKTLSEIHRVLAPNGKIILVQPNFAYAYRQYFDDFTHQQIYTHISLHDVVTAAGLKVTTVRPKFLPFSMRSSLPTHPMLVWLYLRSPIKPLAGQMLLVGIK